MQVLSIENILFIDGIQTLLFSPPFISPTVRLNSFHLNPSTQVFRLESHC
ncbi:hypothetical protein CSC17_4110 [Klebsiella oxytoca]|nr:hypothetical protein CSC17_4110 [Klebsiella oxytoca]